MTASIAKTEGNPLNKFVRESGDQSKNREEPAAETKIPISSRDRHYNNCTTRTEGLIGAENNHNMQEEAIYLGNVG